MNLKNFIFGKEITVIVGVSDQILVLKTVVTKQQENLTHTSAGQQESRNDKRWEKEKENGPFLFVAVGPLCPLNYGPAYKLGKILKVLTIKQNRLSL